MEALSASDVKKILKRENFGMKASEFKKLREDGLNLEFTVEPVEATEKFEIYTHIGESAGNRKHKVKLISQRMQPRQISLNNVFKILKEVGVGEFKVVISGPEDPTKGKKKER